MEIITLWMLLANGETVYQRASIPECNEIGAHIEYAESMGYEIRHKSEHGDHAVQKAGCTVFELTSSVGPCQDEDDA
jgi:hypothetical protein